MVVGSVISGAFIIPSAHARYSPQRITTFANLLLLLVSCLMVLVHPPIRILSSRGDKGRMNATMVMVSQGATALGGVIWGLAAHHAGVVPTFLGAAFIGLIIMVVVRVVPGLQMSIDYRQVKFPA